MTCVWKGLLEGLKKIKLIPNKCNVDTFVKNIKKNNLKTINVAYNGEKLTQQMIEENFQRIKEISNIEKGYLCSTCDPLMLLICELYNVNIIHRFLDNNIKYIKQESNIFLYFISDSEHFWFDKKKNF